MKYIRGHRSKYRFLSKFSSLLERRLSERCSWQRSNTTPCPSPTNDQLKSHEVEHVCRKHLPHARKRNRGWAWARTLHSGSHPSGLPWDHMVYACRIHPRASVATRNATVTAAVFYTGAMEFLENFLHIRTSFCSDAHLFALFNPRNPRRMLHKSSRPEAFQTNTASKVGGWELSAADLFLAQISSDPTKWTQPHWTTK